MDCRCLPDCPFFNDRMQNMPSFAGVLKQRFCHDDWASCARCMIATELGREAVPPDLFPDERERAQGILDSARV
ncbi:MAG: hypothetical protein EG823_05890 [Actinobacteria bacterium]|nr:hypothetical protein [Actinomycetota bacterium]